MWRVLALFLILATPLHAETMLHRGNRYEPATLDPQKTNTQYEGVIVLDLFEGLLTPDIQGNPTLGLADSWQVSADGKRYTFHLRPGLQWSNGAALDAEAVVASFRRLMDPKTAARFAQLMYVLKNGRAVNTGAAPLDTLGVAALDPATVQIDLEAPTAYFPELLANPFAVIVPAAIAVSDTWTQPGTIISNGAYMLEAWNREDRIVVARNPRFHDAANVKIDKVAYYPIADPNTALARFRSGEFDVNMDLPANQVDMLRAELPAETRIDPALITYYLAFNTTLPKFADKNIRRALSLGLDRDALTDKVLRRGEVPAFSFVPPPTANYTPAAADFATWPLEQRLTAARKLLADAGYTADKPLRFALAYSTNQDLRRLAVVMAAMWKRIGVEAQVQNLEAKIHFANLRQGDYQVALLAWVADVNDAGNFLYILQSSSTGSNYSRYHNKDFDGLMDQAAATADTAKRAEILHAAESIAMAEQPIAPLYFAVNRNLVAARVKGWLPNPTDVHLSRYLTVEAPHG
ncbi:MAG: peptide ABC transporter substrate-binding protein [Rhodospirillaceae bacterium]